MAIFNNISGTAPVAILTAGDNVSKIATIRLTNTHVSFPVVLDLFIDSDSLGKFYFAKGLTMASGSTIVLKEGLNFDNTASGYSMYAQLRTDVTVDVVVFKS
mgnify:CR=1 FL=1|tara:strand:+ start:484 stop:789 length:306 start_codon:yes stop_codon:yes gene_type:complete